MPSLKIVAGSLLMVALVLALGMTGGQVRQLAGRVTSLESEQVVFERRVLDLREDNRQLLSRMRDYQEVLEVAQEANVSLSKRLVNREAAVEDLQVSLSSIIEEKYDSEQRLRNEIDALENKKRDLGAQVAALSDAVGAQGREIATLNGSYRAAEGKLAEAGRNNNLLLAENNRYLGMMANLQDELDLLQSENSKLATDFSEVQTQAEALAEERIALRKELAAMAGSDAAETETPPVELSSFGDEDPFGLAPE